MSASFRPDVAEPPVERSSLVTAIAWFGILGGALGTASGLGLMLAAPSVTNVAVLVGAASTLYSSIGLRARREWARVGFMFVLGVTAVAGIFGAVRFRMPRMNAPGFTPEQVDMMVRQMRPMMIGTAVLGAIINALLIAHLSSDRVRREFVD